MGIEECDNCGIKITSKNTQPICDCSAGEHYCSLKCWKEKWIMEIDCRTPIESEKED